MINEKQINFLIGQRIILTRKQRGLPRNRLASLLGISHQQLDKYERGINRISAAKLVIICQKLKIDPLFFYSDLIITKNITKNIQKDLNEVIAYFVQIKQDSKRIAILSLLKELVL